ncbi:hypothetical protein HDV05_007612 [Chytridiales sp. JEL 0842]|nr:hypothetical protein HDV05_007612 [Chytridiales sp. JEL 0842]
MFRIAPKLARCYSTPRAIKPIYTATATSTGLGRSGLVKSTEGFSATMVYPKALGGPGNDASNVNPEILFAAGYAACFRGAMGAVAKGLKLEVPEATEVTAKVDLGTLVEGTGFGLAVDLQVKVPGLDKGTAQQLVEKAHEVCPYSNATRGNINVKVSVV